MTTINDWQYSEQEMTCTYDAQKFNTFFITAGH